MFAEGLSAQVRVGDGSMNLDGTLSLGYNADYSNSSGSDHSFDGGGTANLAGYYFNPNFFSFDVQPFYDQSRVNSSFQSITGSSGLNSSASIFSGSQYPGSISFSKTYNSSGNFAVPGVSNYTTHGDSDTLSINWGAHLQGLPSLNLGFTEGGGNYSVYGENQQGTSHTNTFTASSSYRVAGFNLNGGYQYTSSNSITPEFLTGDIASEQSSNSANTFSFGVGHDLPLHGSFSAGASRSTLDSNFYETGMSTTINNVNVGLGFAPVRNLNVGSNTYYTDNLQGAIISSLLSAGVVTPEVASSSSSNSLSLSNYASYDLPKLNLHLRFTDDRQQQTFLGESFVSNAIGANATYFRTLLGGQFNGVVGVTRTSVSSTNQSMTGLNGSTSYIREIQRWTISASANYSQDTQTILAAYTTSNYGYSGSLGRRLGRRSHWGAAVSGARSLLTDQPGSASSSQNYSTTLSLAGIGISGSYSKSTGNALLTPTGLVATPVPLPVVSPGSVIFYNGSSYSVGIGSSPVHGLTLAGTFAKALSGTESGTTSSNNSNDNLNFLLVYRVRKLNFTAGYSRLVQGFSLLGAPPTMVGSYYFGISRWFKAF